MKKWAYLTGTCKTEEEHTIYDGLVCINTWCRTNMTLPECEDEYYQYFSLEYLGTIGWELISIIPSVARDSAYSSVIEYTVIFKREIEE